MINLSSTHAVHMQSVCYQNMLKYFFYMTLKRKEKNTPKTFSGRFLIFCVSVINNFLFFFQLFLLIIPCIWHLKHCAIRTGAHICSLQVVFPCLSIHTRLLSWAAVPWRTWTITGQYLLVKKRIRLHLKQIHNNSNKKLHLCYVWPWSLEETLSTKWRMQSLE